MVSGSALRREGGEAAQIAEHHDHLDAPPVEHAVVAGAVDQFGHLRREKALEPADAFRALLRNRQFAGHLVEPGREPLEFVACRDADPVVELSCADAARPRPPAAVSARPCAGSASRRARPRARRRRRAARPCATGRRRSARMPRRRGCLTITLQSTPGIGAIAASTVVAPQCPDRSRLAGPAREWRPAGPGAVAARLRRPAAPG